MNDESMKNLYNNCIYFVFLMFFFLHAERSNAQGASCGAAVALTVNGAGITGTISDTTVNDPTIAAGCSGGATSRDGWYSFVATTTTATVTCVTSNRQQVLYGYSGACGTLTQIACANANTTAGGQTEVMNLTGLTVTATYYIRVVNSTANNMNITSIAVATPPANDNCAGAINLTPAASCTITSGTTVGATQSIAGITCAGFTGNADDDVWYSFTASATNHTITVAGLTGFDAVVDLRSGACNGTNISCADATTGGGTETINATGLSIGTTYYVRVYSYGTTSGSFTICVTLPPSAPANNDCAGAVSLTVNPTTTCTTSTSGTTVAATQSQAACIGSGADDDVWYSFTATGTSHIVTATPGTLSDAVLQVFSGSCGSLTSLACIDNTSGASAETTTLTGLTGGATYYVRVHSYANGTNQGTFSLCITTPPVGPANDNCGGAVSLTVNPTTTCTTSTSGTTVSATQSQAACVGSGADDDVWYSFTATASTHIVTVTPGTLSDAVLQVFSGSCGTLTSLACVDATVGASVETSTLSGLTAGNTYFVRVHSYSNGTNQGTFTICVTTLAPPSNDNCAGATSLTVNAGTTCSSTTSGTSLGATQSQVGCSGTADDDVWYSFTATGATHAVTVTPTTMSDAVFQLFSGACGSLTSLGCINATTGTANETATFTSLTTGATYYVRVYSAGTTGGTFTVCVTSPPPPPANDNCAGAVALTVNPSTTCTATTSGTSVSASQSQAGCAGTADDDVWYSFVATGSSHTVSVTPGTMSDVVFQIFSGSCGTLTSLACVDATVGASAESTTIGGLTAGNTYFVRVHSYGNGTNQGTFTVCVTTPATTTSDECTGAVALTVNPNLTCTTTTSATTVGATQSMAGCFGTADDDVWFTFVATGTTHTVSVAPGTLYDAVFQVFSGTCGGTLTSLDCVDNTTGTSSESTTISGLTAGVTYFVRVYSYFGLAGDQGTFTICVTTPVPLSNDNCGSAIGLTVNPTTSCAVSTTGSTVSATQSLAGCSGTADDDVWYSFVATSTTHNIRVTPGTLYDPVFQVFSGSCGGLTSIDCVDDTVGVSVESATITGLTIGNTYFVRVYSYYGIAGDQGTFTICVTTQTSCSGGGGSGTTDLGCPSVLAGGLGLSGADPTPISCTSGGCVDLEATYLQLGQPTSYTVQSIPYAPPYQYDCLANAVSVNNDDVWSPIINLPFNFCFYGNTYNQCLISSNGIITFDTVNNTPGGYSSWSFNVNAPSATLSLNSIFGVYHDIDPRVGGTVGWELITLNTGCRALVAAWNDIPMFYTSCNSQLYTGMIVLYENTNIIDVYIREKNVCASWNNGNAIVGIQNATGTAGTVAPGRNGLDADWTVSSSTNEAWRFVPSGTSITSIRWYEGAGTTGPMIGTTDVINVCPLATTVYTAEVTYTLCDGSTVRETESTTVNVNLSKVWNGSVNTNWDEAGNWTPVGVPTALDCVIVPNVTNDPIISGTGYDALAYSLRVLNGGFLTMNSANNLTVTNIVNVNAGGIFNIQDDASLLQIDNVANTGIVNMQRTTPPVYRFDYTYWNSPMTLASNYTLGMLSQNLTQYDKYYHWTPSVSGGTGIWAQESVATVMDPTKGYIVRAPNTYSFTPTVFTPYTATFTGTPNNGPVNCPITYGSDGSTINDQWNLIGNPYPSAVNALPFVTANTASFYGTLYFWTHNSAISPAFPDPFYNDFVLNYTSSDYASWNSTGGTAASSGGAAPGGYIAAAQSFFVLATGSGGNAQFTNAMRVKNNNGQFFRPGSLASSPGNSDGDQTLEKHRIWLNMTNNLNAFNQLLVGYVQNATMDFDGLFDGESMNQSNVNFYSVLPGHKLVIQGRSLPFDEEDQVPLGYSAGAAGEFSIRIARFDEWFEDYNIYVEDKLLNVIHDLKVCPYVFATQAGQFDERFVLRYTANALGTGQQLTQSANAFIRDNTLFVRATGNIEQVTVYDVTGKLIREYLPKSAAHSLQEDFNYAQGVYLAKIRCSDGTEANVKLMN